MHPLPFYHPSLPAMPLDIVGTIIKHLSDDSLSAEDRQRPVVRAVALWSRSCHAARLQLKPWLEANASPDEELQRRLGAAIAYGEPLLKLWQAGLHAITAWSGAAGGVAHAGHEAPSGHAGGRAAGTWLRLPSRFQLSGHPGAS